MKCSTIVYISVTYKITKYDGTWLKDHLRNVITKVNQTRHFYIQLNLRNNTISELRQHFGSPMSRQVPLYSKILV